MRDPHVESLRYRFQPDETWAYVNPPRLERETDDFRYVLDNGTLTLHMKKHYASAEEAKVSADEFLFVWELDAALLGRGTVRFVYEDAQLIDRIPPPPGTFEINATEAPIVLSDEVAFRVNKTAAAYPEPPSNMKFTPDLETLWIRYNGYRAKREPLSSMAYFCLTVLETSAGSRGNECGQSS